MAETSETEVLIVGAGPSGLAAATELLMRGHSVRVVEKNDRAGVQPRAKTTNVRTMAQMRRWGLASEVRARRPLADDFPRNVNFQYGLYDTPLAVFEDSFASTPQRREAFPEHAEFIPQYVIEGILAAHVAAHPRGRVDFGRKLMRFEQDAEGVTAHVSARDGSNAEDIRARFMIGSDGGRSTVRESLGIGMQGRRDLVQFVTLIVRLPGIGQDPRIAKALFHWILDPRATSYFGPMDTEDTWFFGKVAPHDTTTEALREVVQHTVGPDYPVEVLARDEWSVHQLIADRYREGRIFLAGDACHLHAPFGGHGMNLGIGDGVDLGWKLSAALEGWAGEGLLESYEVERKQVHEAVVASATENVSLLSDHFSSEALNAPGPEGEAEREKARAAILKTKLPEFRSLGLVLGYRYSGSSALAEEAGEDIPLEITDYRPSARPGHLAPHAWLDGDVSLYDRFGPGYTLLRLKGEDAAGEAALAETATAQGVPFKVYAPEIDLAPLYGAGYALVRPDQHVAWRGDALPSPEGLMDLMRGKAAPGAASTAA